MTQKERLRATVTAPWQYCTRSRQLQRQISPLSATTSTFKSPRRQIMSSMSQRSIVSDFQNLNQNSFLDKVFSSGLGSKQIKEEIRIYIEQHEQRHNLVVQGLKRHIQIAKVKVEDAIKDRSSKTQEMNELQTAFKECIIALKREKARKKNQNPTAKKESESLPSLPLDPDDQSITLMLTNLKDKDKQKILELFISDHNFLLAIQDFIFKPKSRVRTIPPRDQPSKSKHLIEDPSPEKLELSESTRALIQKRDKQNKQKMDLTSPEKRMISENPENKP